MQQLSDLKPVRQQLVIDLVKQAGVDVTDWSTGKGGIAKAASNPKYCYEWAFIQEGVVVVLNWWYEELLERDGVILVDLNMREVAHEFGRIPNKSVWGIGTCQ